MSNVTVLSSEGSRPVELHIEVVVFAQALTEWAADKIADVQGLVITAIALMAVILIASTWWTTKALVPTVTALLLAGLVLWAVSNVDWFQARIGDEVQTGWAAAPPATPPSAVGAAPSPTTSAGDVLRW